jgi:polyhydroxybutyrate depolymerase
MYSDRSIVAAATVVCALSHIDTCGRRSGAPRGVADISMPARKAPIVGKISLPPFFIPDCFSKGSRWLALEAPSRFRAVAAVAASVPTPENFKCKPAGTGTSVMIMNGTKDPLVPFDGGEVNLLGWFYKGGNVRPARESAQYYADLNQLAGTPETNQTVVAGVTVEQVLWGKDSKTEVELLAIHGGGHGLPQPYFRRPRLLGPSPMAPDGPAIIWEFLARQRP